MGNIVKKVWKPIESAITSARDASLDLVGLGPEDPVQAKELTGLTQSERASLADEEAQRQAKKSSKKTASVLTSPLGGGAPNVSTAVKKLGG